MNFYRTELYYLSRGKNIGIFPVSLTSVCTSYKAHLFVNESKARDFRCLILESSQDRTL